MANIFDMADAWNDAAQTFTAIKMNVTDKASAAGSLLMDLQVGGASRFRVDKNGSLTAGGGASLSGNLSMNGGSIIFGFAGDLQVHRDDPATFAQRNGANAQAHRLYSSYTDAANFTRLALKTAMGVHTLETESAGTGEANIDLAFVPKGTGRVRFGTLTASADAPVTGYIEVKDAAGTVRRLAVIA